MLNAWSLERGLMIGGVLAVAGLLGLVASLTHWGVNDFGELDPRHSLRLVVPSATALMMSCQVVLGTFFISILGIRRSSHPGTEPGDDTLTVPQRMPASATDPADATEPEATDEERTEGDEGGPAAPKATTRRTKK